MKGFANIFLSIVLKYIRNALLIRFPIASLIFFIVSFPHFEKKIFSANIPLQTSVTIFYLKNFLILLKSLQAPAITGTSLHFSESSDMYYKNSSKHFIKNLQY